MEIGWWVAFPSPPADSIGPPLHWESTARQRIDEDRVRRTLFDQSQKKEPRLDRLNFSPLRLLWECDAGRIIALLYYSICLGHHPRV